MKKLTTLKETLEQLQEALDIEAFKPESKGNPYFEQAKSAFGKDREIEVIFADCETLWNCKPFNFKGLNLTGPDAFMRLLVKIRAINRDLKMPNGEVITVTQGDGLRHEFIFRVFWLVVKHRKTFMSNLDLITSIGSVRDWFELWRVLLQYRDDKGNMYISMSFMTKHTVKMLNNEVQREYVLKYMPTITAKGACTTFKKQANNIIASAIAKDLFVHDGKVWDEVLDPQHKREGMTLFNEDRTFNINARAILQKNYRNLKKTSKANEALRIASSLTENSDPEKEIKDQKILESLDTSALPSRLRYVWRNGFAKTHGLTLTKPLSLYKVCAKFEDLHEPTSEEAEEFNSKLIINPRGIPKMLVFLDLKNAAEASVPVANLDFTTVASLYATIVNQSMKDTNFYKNIFVFRNGLDTQSVIGDTILEQFVDTMTLSSEGVADVDLNKCILLLTVLKNLKDLPNKILVITSNDIKVDFADWEKMEETLNENFSKEFVNKLEMIIWNPTAEKNNYRIGNIYQVFGMNKDLLNYLCGKTRTASKTNAMKQDIMRKVHLPAIKATAAKKSGIKKN